VGLRQPVAPFSGRRLHIATTAAAATSVSRRRTPCVLISKPPLHCQVTVTVALLQLDFATLKNSHFWFGLVMSQVASTTISFSFIVRPMQARHQVHPYKVSCNPISDKDTHRTRPIIDRRKQVSHRTRPSRLGNETRRRKIIAGGSSITQ
jgi:hypothetical protein